MPTLYHTVRTVRYYGYYSNKSRGVRAKADAKNAIASSQEASTAEATNTIPIPLSRKRFKKNWARLIQKIYNIDPLKCPKCGGKMRIVSFIEEESVIKKILSHLNLWLPQYHDPPDYPDICNNLTGGSSSPPNTEYCENLQLNMFSDRSFEWWEAGIRQNAGFGNYQDKNLRKLHTDYKNRYLQEDYRQEYAECQHPYEDAYSQEVFYED